jgi:short chain dehydrogenase
MWPRTIGVGQEEVMAYERHTREARLTVGASSLTPATEELAKKDFPSFDLTRKKALVTGATKGLGRHAATALAHAGVDVFLSGRDEGELAECAEEVRAQGRRAETQRLI